MNLWTAKTAAAATKGTAQGGDWTASGVSIDTRTLAKGDLFVALSAARDGHEFVAQALEKGVAAALVSHIPEGLENAPLLLVDDVQKALEDLARAARPRAGKLIAVTGSVGKTGTKEMLRTCLAGQGHVHAAEKSYNNHWGVPLTMARMPEGTDFAIIEIGMNHPGEIAPLARIARPEVAVITNVAPVHLAAFDSLNAIAIEKASITEALQGTAVLNGDGEMAANLADIAKGNGAEILQFGAEAGNDFRLIDATILSDRTKVHAMTPDGARSFEIGASGRHFAINALAALAAVYAAGGGIDPAAEALTSWHPPTGRGERWAIGPLTLIDDAYNANPLSMGAALEGLARAKGRKLAILGDMLELGNQELAMHAGLADHPALVGIERLHCVGPRMRALYEALPREKRGLWVETSADLLGDLESALAGFDVVMVKGSLGARLGVVVDAIKKMGDAVTLNETGGI